MGGKVDFLKILTTDGWTNVTCILGAKGMTGSCVSNQVAKLRFQTATLVSENTAA
jgi:hypothetical protein